MKISELIVEDQVDERVGQAIGKAWGGAMRGVGATAGGLAGSWDAMKQGYRAGKAAVSGRANSDDQDPTLTRNQSGTTSPAQQGSATQQPAGSQSQTSAPTGQAASTPNQSNTGTPAGATTTPAAMKAAEIVKDLDDVWDKATADQGSQTTSVQVQQKIRAMAKAAGMAGQVVERKKIAEFHSRFLGMTI